MWLPTFRSPPALTDASCIVFGHHITARDQLGTGPDDALLHEQVLSGHDQGPPLHIAADGDGAGGLDDELRLH